MLFSTFEDIIFLDADAFPAHSPDDLFDVDPYKTSGLVTFPDFWWSTTSPLFFRIAGMTEPSIRDRKTSESGILLLSKRINGHTLLLATYYNYYGPDYFYPLLSQGGIGQGDKETFLHAAMALGASFYDVKTPVKNIGAWINGTFFNAGMKQGDPVEDYSIHQAKTKAQNAGLEAAAPEADNRTKTFARSFFIHNNIYKLDVRHLSGNLAGWRNGPSHFVRLWGEKENNEHKFGYDIEKVLWEEVLIVACEFGREECEKSQAYIKEGFHE
jgi:alpha 1,2-mannosyltransferase